MKQELNFTGEGPLAPALGVTKERMDDIQSRVQALLAAPNASIRTVLTAMNEAGDLSFAEWTGLVYSLGYWQAHEHPNRFYETDGTPVNSGGLD